MRVTGNTIAASVVSQLNLLAARQARLQNQASTGQRIAAPEDDPAGMAQALGLQHDSLRSGQYARTISTLQNRANLVYSAVGSLKNISDRAGELATLADGTRSPQELQTYASELNQLIQQAVQLANSKDGESFLFAGTAGSQAPFTTVSSADGQVSAVDYNGNTAVSQVEIGENSTLALDVPGANNSGSGARGLLSDSRFGADLFAHLISLRDHLQTGNTTAIANQDRPALGQDEQNLIFHVANNGVLQARLDVASVTASNHDAGLQQQMQSITGADLSQTIVQLTQAQNAYQLAAQSSAKLLQLQQSLLSYLP